MVFSLSRNDQLLQTMIHSPYLRLGCLLCMAVALFGCTDSQTRSDENADVIRVENTDTNVWEDHEKAPLQFEHEQTFGADEDPRDKILADARGLAVDTDGTVYILDMGNHRLVAFNPDGTIRWSAGRQGEGPGEFFLPQSLVWDGDRHLYVANQFGARIDVWNTDGTFQDSQSIDDVDRASGLRGVVDGHLVNSSPGFGKDPAKVHLIDAQRWALHDKIHIRAEHTFSEGIGLGFDVETDNDGFWVGNVATYAISRYDFEGQKTHEITRTNIDFPEIEALGREEGGPSLDIRSRVQAPLRLDSGHLLVASNWQTSSDDEAENTQEPVGFEGTYSSAVDLFNPEGMFMGRIRWDKQQIPDIGELRSIGPDGKLYTFHSEPFPQIRRYAISINE